MRHLHVLGSSSLHEWNRARFKNISSWKITPYPKKENSTTRVYIIGLSNQCDHIQLNNKRFCCLQSLHCMKHYLGLNYNSHLFFHSYFQLSLIQHICQNKRIDHIMGLFVKQIMLYITRHVIV